MSWSLTCFSVDFLKVFSLLSAGHNATSFFETEFISVPRYRFHQFISAPVFDVILVGVH